MDVTEGQRKLFFRISTILLTMAIICYAIVMGVGWVLAIREEPGQPLILAGAIVSTIPVLSLVSYLCFAFTFSEACEDGFLVKFGVLSIQSCAELVQMIGAALFIVAGATLNNPTVLAYGVSAGVFGMIGGCCCILSQCYCCTYMCAETQE